MCNEKPVTPTNTLAEPPQKEISITAGEGGFDLSAKGFDEEFILKVLAQLQGKEVQPPAAAPTTIKTQVKVEEPKTNEELAHMIATSVGKLVSRDVRLESRRENAENAPQDKKNAKVNTELPESLKARVSQSNTELVYTAEDKDDKDEKPFSTIGDQLIDLASGMYKAAGVNQEHGEDEKPDYFRTGIKYDQYDRPKFRTYYECPKCSSTGRHYLPIGTKRVSCHQCLASLKVDHATKNRMTQDDIKEISEENLNKFRDESGNFYIAKKLDIQTFR